MGIELGDSGLPELVTDTNVDLTARAAAAAAQATATAAQATATAAQATAAAAQLAAAAAQVDADCTAPPVADLTALGALDSSALPAGATRYVVSLADHYVLTNGSYTVDGVDVIAATGAGWYWIATLAGRWDDLQGDVSQGTAAAALTYEVYRDTPFFMYFFRHNQSDSLSMRYQFPHGVHLTTAVVPHLHLIPMVSPGGTPQNLRLIGRYTWSSGGAAVPANASWTTFGPINVPIAAGDEFVPKLVDLATVTAPASMKGSDHLLVFCQRDGTNIGDTYNTGKVGGTALANVALLSLDCHYRKATRGSLLAAP